MERGGFDVIIGNPPYVAYPLKDDDYVVRGYDTARCGNLYAYTVERSLHVSSGRSRIGMIVPLSLTFSRDFTELRAMLRSSGRLLVHSSFDNVPDRAFTGAKESTNTSKNNQQRVTIFLLDRKPGEQRVFSTPILRWRTHERRRLFQELPLTDATDLTTDDDFPKLGDPRLVEFLRRWLSAGAPLAALVEPRGKWSLVVPRTAGYYVAAYRDEMERTQQKRLSFGSRQDRDLAMALLNSNAYFWLWRTFGDAFHVTDTWTGMCPVPETSQVCTRLAAELDHALSGCTVYKGYRGVPVPNANFNQRMDILFAIDQWIIDAVAPDLGVTPADFLWAKSNSFLSLEVPKSDGYPEGWRDGGGVKYRMGRDGGGVGVEE